MNSGSYKKYTEQVSPKRETICGLLDDMGGRRSISGGLGTLSRQSIENANQSALLNGLGWNPEDLHCNPIKWALMADIAWRSPIPSTAGMINDIQSWVVEYATRRYPSPSAPANAHVAAAWTALLESAYGGNRTAEDTSPAPRADTSTYDINTATALGSQDSDKFSKDGLARFPSFTLHTYASPKPAGILTAWRELLAATEADPAIAHSSSFRYDLVDVVRQSLQNLFAVTFQSIQTKCTGAGESSSAGAAAAVAHNWTEHPHSNCAGSCLANNAGGAPNGGHCDRMPSCGHDAGLPDCNVGQMKARCLAASPYQGKTCTAFTQNGYMYDGKGVTPFHNYPLSCFVLDAPPAPPPTPPPPPNMTICAAALAIAPPLGNAGVGVAVDDLSEAEIVMALGADLDRILLTDKHFLLTSWIDAAKAFGNSSDERMWLEWNARVQVTSWGSIESNRNTITDYASKQWGGLVGSYHLPIWRHFFARSHAEAAAKRSPAAIATALAGEMYTMGAVWTNSTARVPGMSAEDTVAVAKELLAKWT